MSEGRSSISNATTYKEMGEFWDTHDAAEYWDQSEPVHFDFDGATSTFYFRIEATLAEKLRAAAKQRGVSSETLLNLWVQEKLGQEPPPKPRRGRETTAEPTAPDETAEPTALPEGEAEPVAVAAQA